MTGVLSFILRKKMSRKMQTKQLSALKHGGKMQAEKSAMEASLAIGRRTPTGSSTKMETFLSFKELA